MTAEELYAMEAETGRTSEWEPLYRAEKARADAAEAAVARVRALHQPFRIYDECECADPEAGVDGHVDIDEVGITCNLLYVACRECCIENPEWPEQAEWCADRHDHLNDGQCPTIAALDAP